MQANTEGVSHDGDQRSFKIISLAKRDVVLVHVIGKEIAKAGHDFSNGFIKTLQPILHDLSTPLSTALENEETYSLIPDESQITV